jgi:hypothetical protein
VFDGNHGIKILGSTTMRWAQPARSTANPAVGGVVIGGVVGAVGWGGGGGTVDVNAFLGSHANHEKSWFHP